MNCVKSKRYMSLGILFFLYKNNYNLHKESECAYLSSGRGSSQ